MTRDELVAIVTEAMLKGVWPRRVQADQIVEALIVAGVVRVET